MRRTDKIGWSRAREGAWERAFLLSGGAPLVERLNAVANPADAGVERVGQISFPTVTPVAPERNA